jgi:uncharacterized membrane protein YkoI
MNVRLFACSLAALCLGGIAVLAFAADDTSSDIRALLQSGEILSQEAILRRVAENYPGRVSEIELTQKNGRAVYEVDIVDDRGVKLEVKFDAKTGEILSSQIDDAPAKGHSKKGDDDDDDDN